MKIQETEKSMEFDKLKSDWHLSNGDIRSANGSIEWDQSQLSLFNGVENGVMRLSYTDHSFGQLCRRLSIPVLYAKRCPNDLKDHNINYWLSHEDNASNGVLVRAYDGKARAILSNRYNPISNTNILHGVESVVQDQLRYNAIVTPDYMYLKLISMHTPDGLYGMGVVVSNGEIGDYAFRISPYIQRHSCSNSIVFQDNGFYMRHTANSSDQYIMATLKEKIREALNIAPDCLDRFLEAETKELPDIGQTIDHICSMRGYTSDVKLKIIVGTEGKTTDAAVANGLSYAAHEVFDSRLSIDLEIAAGSYLMGSVRRSEEDQE